MSAVAAITGDRRPVIVEQLHIGPAHAHHRLDGQHHAFPQPDALAGAAVIGHLRIFVHAGADAVSHELTHHAEAV